MKAQRVLAALPIPLGHESKNTYESVRNIGGTTNILGHEIKYIHGYWWHRQYPLGRKFEIHIITCEGNGGTANYLRKKHKIFIKILEILAAPPMALI